MTEHVSYPKGHSKNPMTDADITSKFTQLSEGVIASGARDALLDALWRADEAHDIVSVIELVRVER